MLNNCFCSSSFDPFLIYALPTHVCALRIDAVVLNIDDADDIL
jgi:hypothetical protein